MEVSASPKPGLVDRLGSGAHTDMDFSTFLASITAITPYYCACAQTGLAPESRMRKSVLCISASVFAAAYSSAGEAAL